MGMKVRELMAELSKADPEVRVILAIDEARAFLETADSGAMPLVVIAGQPQYGIKAVVLGGKQLEWGRFLGLGR